VKRSLQRLFYRLRQFGLAITSRMTNDDREFERKYLTIPEAALFDQLPPDEQKHSVVVARRMLSLAHTPQADVDERVIAKVGLLHDIGKSAIKLGVIDRSILVAMRRLARPLYDKIAQVGRSETALRLSRKFYVHKEHAGIGSDLLRKANTDDKIIRIVASHDDPPSESDPIELFLLRKVDSAN